ncbi:MAG: ABC-F family ATP-binding cassette domain-containing protein [Acidobacteria bacterium]|nr:ABC-F family ATP-binding cassette domain-containing protein [Acidobacteriota bacterium]
MASLINCRGLGKSYGPRTLFDGLDLTIAEGDRVGIIGPNGAGKTTLLNILIGEDEADTGIVHRRKGLRLAMVPQDPQFDLAESVLTVVTRAARLRPGPGETAVEIEVRAKIVMERMGFSDVNVSIGTLSGGWRKRVAVAAALASGPELLLLDEPTNHLDLEGMLHLERLLTSERLAFVLISHDRVFLDRTVTRILEVAPQYPGGVFAAEGSYSGFLHKREAFLTARAQYREGLANRVRRELEWLGRGPKARTTKAQARIDAAEELQEELRGIDQTTAGKAQGIELTGSGRKTKRLLAATDISKSLGGKELFSGLDVLLRPGQCLGVVGANGSGKSTLLKVFAGEIEVDEGSLRLADGLRTVYFDQNREQLDPRMPLRRALAELSDTVIYRGNPVHVVTWAKRFLFSADQLDLPLSELSGGEKARVHIARLMLRPADLLILDEPTNDLDIPTLEVLEESLADFPGALVLVTHDRLLMDRVATVLLGLGGRGGATFFADVAQWEETVSTARQKTTRKGRISGPRGKKKKSGLSYLEKREYESIEEAIAAAERDVEGLVARLQDPTVVSDAHKAHEAFEAHNEAQLRLEQLFDRWAELEEKKDQE